MTLDREEEKELRMLVCDAVDEISVDWESWKLTDIVVTMVVVTDVVVINVVVTSVVVTSTVVTGTAITGMVVPGTVVTDKDEEPTAWVIDRAKLLVGTELEDRILLEFKG